MLIKAFMVALFAIIAIVIGVICRKHARMSPASF